MSASNLPSPAEVGRAARDTFQGRFLAGLYLLEGSAFLTLLTLYRRGERPLADFIADPVGVVFALAVVGTAAGVFLMWNAARRRLTGGATQVRSAVLLNLFTLAMGGITAEIAVRVLATERPEGAAFGNITLFPRSWERLATRAQGVATAGSETGSYIVPDEQLGWTVGPSRQSRLNGESDQEGRERAERYLYSSSVEGIRSAQAGIVYAMLPARRRIALVGDSFTFGLNVYFEETWGYHLQKRLGPEFQALNFGVDGYGIDQAILRYRRDVVGWRPEVVILGLIDDDLKRAMCVYGFLCFQDGTMPFPKPRYVLQEGTLTQVNLPLPRPQTLFARASVHDLPHIAYDRSYVPAEWKRRFLLDDSYAVRLILSVYHPIVAPAPAASDDELRLVSGAFLRWFRELAQASRAIPIVVYFPMESTDLNAVLEGKRSVAQQVLDKNGIPFVDTTKCVAALPASERYVAGHFSARANAAVGKCIGDALVMHGAIAGDLASGPPR